MHWIYEHQVYKHWIYEYRVFEHQVCNKLTLKMNFPPTPQVWLVPQGAHWKIGRPVMQSLISPQCWMLFVLLLLMMTIIALMRKNWRHGFTSQILLTSIFLLLWKFFYIFVYKTLVLTWSESAGIKLFANLSQFKSIIKCQTTS